MRPSSPMPREWRLLLATFALVALALGGPTLAQVPHYHAFADQGSWRGLAHAGDVLSNLPFALAGLMCLAVLHRAAGALSATERGLLALTGAGLLMACAASTWYHLAPDDARLAVDRAGMVPAFAGLLGLAACRISSRAGAALATAVLLAGPGSILVWVHTGDLWPWAVLQGGGALLLAALATQAHPMALRVQWAWVAGLYGGAKLLELGDQAVWSMTHGLVSGHSLKHVVAALAVLPVIAAVARVAPHGQNARKLPARAA